LNGLGVVHVADLSLPLPRLPGKDAYASKLCYALAMPEDKPDEDPGQPAPRIIYRPATVQISAESGVTANVRVRLIQSSPDADPKLVEVARQMAQELKEKQGDVEEHIDYIPEAPLVLPDHK
jgi:hypothetical protein